MNDPHIDGETRADLLPKAALRETFRKAFENHLGRPVMEREVFGLLIARLAEVEKALREERAAR